MRKSTRDPLSRVELSLVIRRRAHTANYLTGQLQSDHQHRVRRGGTTRFHPRCSGSTSNKPCSLSMTSGPTPCRWFPRCPRSNLHPHHAPGAAKSCVRAQSFDLKTCGFVDRGGTSTCHAGGKVSLSSAPSDTALTASIRGHKALELVRSLAHSPATWLRNDDLQRCSRHRHGSIDLQQSHISAFRV